MRHNTKGEHHQSFFLSPRRKFYHSPHARTNDRPPTVELYLDELPEPGRVVVSQRPGISEGLEKGVRGEYPLLQRRGAVEGT